MAAVEVTKAGQLGTWSYGCRNNSFEALSGLHFQGVDHPGCGFAEGNHEHAAVGIKLVEVFADAQHAAFAINMALEGTVDAGFGEGVFKKLAGCDPHVEGKAFAINPSGP